MKKITLATFVILFISLAGAQEVFAHATPITYEPESASILEKAPDRVLIYFSERVDVNASSIEVFGPNGERIDNNDARVASDNPRLFQISIKTDRGEGTHTVSWKVLSADDGHFSKGAFIFSIGKETGSGLSSADQFQVVYRSNIGEATTIFIELLGQGLLVALLIIYIFGLLPLRKNLRFRELFQFDEAFQKRFAVLLFLGVFLIVTGTLSYIVIKSLDLQTFQNISLSEALMSFAPTTAGSFTLYRTGLAVLLLVMFLFSRKKVFDEKKGKYWLFAMLGVLILIALARGRVSHAAASHFLPVFSVFVMFLQVFWKSFWVGGVAVLIFLLIPLAKKGGLRSFILASTSFSKLVSIAFGFVGVSGAYIVWLDLKDPSFVLTSDWGTRFIVLSLIGGAIFLVRLFHQLYIDRIGTKMIVEKTSNAKLLKWVAYSLPLEFLIGIALLFVSSFMVITSPPVAKQTLFEKSAISQGTKVTLTEHRFEDKNLFITVADEKTNKPVAVNSITITLFNEAYGIGPIVVDSEKRFDGAFVFSKKSLSPLGEWKIDIVASRPGSYDSVSSFVIDYPKEVESNHTDPNRRSFNLFAILNILVALGVALTALMLYQISQRLLASNAESPSGQGLMSDTTPLLSTKSWLVSFGLAALLVLILWFGYSNVLKSNFQRLCERDGNAWHLMVPTRDNKPTSQISEKGCMAFGGAYFFADEREYEYFFTPVNAKTEIKFNPETVTTNNDTIITFAISDEQGNPITDLVTTHERLMHVIIVSEDFSVFSHVHPEQFGTITPENKNAGKFSVHYSFPKAGKYLIAADYAVRAKSFSNQFIVDVGGILKMGEQAQDTAWQKKFGEYGISFSTFPSGYIQSGTQMVLQYKISKNGKPINDLQAYLGAAMHIAIVKTDLQKFVHTHGEVHPPGTPPTAVVNTAVHIHPAPPKLFGPDVEAHVIFPEPGLYKVFGEFKHGEKNIVTDFTVKVE